MRFAFYWQNQDVLEMKLQKTARECMHSNNFVLHGKKELLVFFADYVTIRKMKGNYAFFLHKYSWENEEERT